MNLDNVKLLIQASTGYTVTDADTALLTYFYNSEEQDISNNCNLEALPDELIYVVEERAAARYMQCKKADVLGDGNADIVKRIKEGDTTVELAGDTASARLDALVTELLRERDLGCYRRLRW